MWVPVGWATMNFQRKILHHCVSWLVDAIISLAVINHNLIQICQHIICNILQLKTDWCRLQVKMYGIHCVHFGLTTNWVLNHMKFRIKIVATSQKASWTAVLTVVGHAIDQESDAIFHSEDQGSVYMQSLCDMWQLKYQWGRFSPCSSVLPANHLYNSVSCSCLKSTLQMHSQWTEYLNLGLQSGPLFWFSIWLCWECGS